MSKLRIQNEDYADAAGKHLGDVEALLTAERNDGAGYLSGYVVECALKALILHDRCFDSNTRVHDKGKLDEWRSTLKKKTYGHDLRALAAATVGTEGARYLPQLPGEAAIFEWQETMRYHHPGIVTKEAAQSYSGWAHFAYAQTILAMRTDGVI